MSEPSTLPEELLRRATEPLGVIDVRGPRERHERAKALLRRHVSPVAHTFTRAGADAPAAAATGLVLVNPPADERLESHTADSPGPLAPVRTADAAPVTQRAVVTNSPARSGDHEQVAPTPLQRVAHPSIGHVRPDGAIATIQRVAAVTTAPLPLPLSAGIPFFTPAAAPTALGDYADGVSRGHNQSTATGATPIDREPVQDAALRLAPRRRQQPGTSKAGGDRRERETSRSPVAPPSRSDESPVLRTRVTAAKPNDVPVRRRIDAAAAAAVAEPPPLSLALKPSATTEVQRVARGVTDATVDTGVPSPAAAQATMQLHTSRPRAEAPATLVHRVQRAPIATAAVEPSTPSAAELPLHSVNTGRITAAIARTATAITPPAAIARASSEPVAVTASVPAVTASDGDRRERTGGGSLSPDGMLSHMLRQIAIERERRGGGRWP